jgi:hypothetical protein
MLGFFGGGDLVLPKSISLFIRNLVSNQLHHFPSSDSFKKKNSLSYIFIYLKKCLRYKICKNYFGVNSTRSPNDFSWKVSHLALSNNPSLNVTYCYISET